MRKNNIINLCLQKDGMQASIQATTCKLTGLRKYRLPDGRSYTNKKAALKEAEILFKNQGFK